SRPLRGTPRDGLISAAVGNRDRRLELIVGVHRDAGYSRRRHSNGRLLRQENNLLPLADRRLAMLDAERRQDSQDSFGGCAVGLQYVLETLAAAHLNEFPARRRIVGAR